MHFIRLKHIFSYQVSRSVNHVYKSRKEQLIRWWHSIDSFCITVDFWTEAHTGIHFGGIALHHIEENTQWCVFVLGCYPYDENDQKAPTGCAFAVAILSEYGLKLDNDKYVTSDDENEPI